ncbi:hypothetical protein MBLNU457_7636t1 [Dothideomycetes sp. NU457]
MRRHSSRPAAAPPPGPGDPLSLLRAFDIDSNPSRPIRPSPLTVSTVQGLPLELLDRLRSYPLFASAPDTFLTAIGRYLRPQIHQAHDPIVSEGEDARAMYWLVRGAVRVTSRDGESTYAELRPGAFFGEIGILMDIPRTATINASVRSLVLRLNKEDLQSELPKFPEVERAIREEAVERLAILERKKKETTNIMTSAGAGFRKRSRDYISSDVEMGEIRDMTDKELMAAKKRKSPSPRLAQAVASSAFGVSHFGKTPMTIRQILKELPLFRNLPEDVLHDLGMNAQPCTFPPFTDILKQGTRGREIYFIVYGEVEVVTSTAGPDTAMHGSDANDTSKVVQKVRARFRSGQYFGEVASLSLAPTRTATVRSINQVECLQITGEVLDELWRKCSPDLRQSVEVEAKKRLDAVNFPSPMDREAEHMDGEGLNSHYRKITPAVTFSEIGFESPPSESKLMVPEPVDPDPYFNIDLDVPRAKSRRSSLAPPSPDASSQSIQEPHSRQSTPINSRSPLGSRSPVSRSTPVTPSSPLSAIRPVDTGRPASTKSRGRLPDDVLVHLFPYLDIRVLMRVRRVSMHWHQLVSTHPDVLPYLDLARYNREMTDSLVTNIIAPFVGSRPRHVNLNNCFHLSDEGFKALAAVCAQNLRTWKMRSVWDVTGPCILDLVNKAPLLEEVDLGNCRKVGDGLLAKIVGWSAPSAQPNAPRGLGIVTNGQMSTGRQMGSSNLKRLTLSYCKHVQDRSMAHIAQNASARLEMIDLTRCTSVTDQGFKHWSMHNFPMLRKLVLADCTYLSDQSIIGIVNAAPNLRELDLSFCCALSDTATEVLSLGLMQLTHLDLAFCGSAVSDSSLRSIGLHLLELRFLSVRGCVRVTGQGVEAVLEGCRSLEVFDVSQCKNLDPWITAGGIPMAKQAGIKTRFDLVAHGTWRNVI